MPTVIFGQKVGNVDQIRAVNAGCRERIYFVEMTTMVVRKLRAYSLILVAFLQ
jgi:hypothetical protein